MLPIMLAIFLCSLGAFPSTASPPVSFSRISGKYHYSALTPKSIYSCRYNNDCWLTPLGFRSTCVNQNCICNFGYVNNYTAERCTRIDCKYNFQCSEHFNQSQCAGYSCVCKEGYTLNTSTVECESPSIPLGAILLIVGGVIVFAIIIVVIVVVLRKQRLAKPGRIIQRHAPPHPGLVTIVPGTVYPQQQFPLQPVAEQARQPAFNAVYPQANYYPQQPAPSGYPSLQGPYQGPLLSQAPPEYSPPEYSPPNCQPAEEFQNAHCQLPSTSNGTPTALKM